MNVLLVLVEMLLETLVDRVIRIFCKDAVKCLAVNVGVVLAVNIIILGVAECNDAVLECGRALLVGVGIGRTVAAVDLRADEVLLDIDVGLDILDGPFLILLGELVCLDERTLEGNEGVRRTVQVLGESDLTAAGLVLQCLLLGAAVYDLVALGFAREA